MNSAATDAGRRARWLRLGLGAVLAGAVLWVFGGIARHGFVMFDDDINLYLNPMLGAPTLARVAWMFTDVGTMLRYLPLGWLGFSTTFALGGLDPAAYHLASLGLHVLNAALACAAFLRLASLLGPREASADAGAWRAWCAAAGAALWALHPLRVEAVAWASGQLYVQATTWALVSTLAFLEALVRRRAGRRASGWLVASWVAYAASLLAYPLAFGLPVALLLIERAGGRPAEGETGRAAAWRRSAWRVGPHAAAAAGALVLALAIRLGSTGLWNPAASASEFGVAARVAQAAYLFVRYLRLSAAPAGLTPADDVLEHFSPWSAPFVAGMAATACLAGLLWIGRKRLPGAAALGLAYLALLAPFLGFLEHPYYPCDRYTYLPSLVLSAALVLGLDRLAGTLGRLAALAASLACAAALALGARAQTHAWRDTETLFTRIVAQAHATRFRELFLARLAWSEALDGRDAEADEDLGRLLAADPGNADLLAVRQRIAGLRGGGAATDLRSSPLARELQRVALEQAKGGRLFDAEQRLRRAVALSPGFAEARFNLAIVLARRGEPRAGLEQFNFATAPGRGVSPGEARRRQVLELFRLSFRAAGDPAGELACVSAERRR